MKLDDTLLKNLYKMMLRIRLCEESFIEPILEGKIRCPVHLYSGEEAIAAGIGAVLTKQDYVFGSHRSHGHCLAKGASMNDLVAEIYTRVTGCSRGRGGSMHLIDVAKGMLGSAPIVGGTISLALGSALSSMIRQDKRVTISYFGDGATGEGVLFESLNFAALKKLPIIFACENNLYSTHMPIDEIRINQDIYKSAEPFGIKSYLVDGNNVFDVYETAAKAVMDCRNGRGPVFIEFKTYRFRGHVGPDDNIQGAHTDIRPLVEIQSWMQKDPIIKLKEYLTKHEILSPLQIENLQKEVLQEVEMAHDLAQNSPRPNVGDIDKYVYH